MLHSLITHLKSLYHFLFHFNPAQDIEWDGRRYEDEDK
jgi:hypothetical protein